jgi:hypothetical protein
MGMMTTKKMREMREMTTTVVVLLGLVLVAGNTESA